MMETAAPAVSAGLVALATVVRLLAGGIEHYVHGRYEKALEGFRQIIEKYEATPYTDDAWCWAGRCHLKLGRLRDAQGCFQKVVDQFRQSEYLPAAQVGLGFLKDQWQEANLAQAGPWDYVDQSRPRAVVASYFFAARAQDVERLLELVTPAGREQITAAMQGAATAEAGRARVVDRFCKPLADLTNFRLGPAVVDLDNEARATVELVYTDSSGRSRIRQVVVVRSGTRWLMDRPF